MGNRSDKQGLNQKRRRDFWDRMLIAKGFVSRFVNLFNVTQQDLKDAGIYHRKMWD